MNKRDDGLKLYGQLYDERVGITRPFVQRMQNEVGKDGKVALWGTEGVEIIPTDANSAQTKQFDVAAVEAQYAGIEILGYPVNVSLHLPDELVSLTAVYSKSKGEGSGSDSGVGDATGTTYGGSLSSSAKGSSSLSTVVDVIPKIRQIWAVDIPAMEYVIYRVGSFTEADLLGLLTTKVGATVLSWPIFHPEAHTVSAKGGQLSLTGAAQAQQSVSASSGGGSATYSTGHSKAVETGAVIRSRELSPTLHGAIAVGNSSETDSIGVVVTVGWTSLSMAWPARSDGITIAPTALLADVFPTTLSPTQPTHVPRSGHFLIHKAPQVVEGRVVRIECQVIDAAIFQTAIFGFVYSDPAPTYHNFILIEPNAPTNEGGLVDSYSISPALPTGLVFSTSTGVISGTAIGPSAADYTITATNSLGSVTVVVHIIVLNP